MDECGHLKPVASRHVPVDDCHVVGRTVGDRLPHSGQGPANAVAGLDRAIDHAQRSDGGDLKGLLQGVELLQRELHGILSKYAVSEVAAEGKLFDPSVHEAMAQVPNDEVAPNTVLEVLQKGYQLRGRLVRAARVVVAKATGTEEESKEESKDEVEGAD